MIQIKDSFDIFLLRQMDREEEIKYLIEEGLPALEKYLEEGLI